ncbi:hypothetical protein B0181_01720 [Moraxella caviae]|uniref:Uncharacterized protein n=1 Tax=Moraxella caviae TaxID=34060 RepID=A0A1T0A9D9_9GAMM|nr:hypothetical protein B0181_01720 [Moraxella caviae]
MTNWSSIILKSSNFGKRFVYECTLILVNCHKFTVILRLFYRPFATDLPLIHQIAYKIGAVLPKFF